MKLSNTILPVKKYMTVYEKGSSFISLISWMCLTRSTQLLSFTHQFKIRTLGCITYTFKKTFLQITFCVCVYVCARAHVCMCVLMCMEVRGKLAGVSFVIPPSESQGSKPDHRAWWQVPLPPEPPHWPYGTAIIHPITLFTILGLYFFSNKRFQLGKHCWDDGEDLYFSYAEGWGRRIASSVPTWDIT